MLDVVVGAATVARAITLPTAAFTGPAFTGAALLGGTVAPGLRTPEDAPTVGAARPTEPLADVLDGVEPDAVELDGVGAGRVVDVVVGATATTGTDGLGLDVRTVSEPLSLFPAAVATGGGVGVEVATGVGVGVGLATTGLIVGL